MLFLIRCLAGFNWYNRTMIIPPTVQELTGLTMLSGERWLFVKEYMLDYDIQRASECVWHDRAKGYQVIAEDEEVRNTITALKRHAQQSGKRIGPEDIETALWDNHMLSRQTGKINSSNKALDQLARLKTIDAYATSKLDVVASTDQEMVDRIRTGRVRAAQTNDEKPLSFL